MSVPKGLYGRLGDMTVLEEKISECENHGLQVEIGLGPSKETDTVVIEDEGETVIRAIHKGDGVYIVMYNPEYYPKPE
tara:strand:+ start:1860 stop:2093 length:234 start_codon:yes stop_codon:yes gene_type:complete